MAAVACAAVGHIDIEPEPVEEALEPLVLEAEDELLLPELEDDEPLPEDDEPVPGSPMHTTPFEPEVPTLQPPVPAPPVPVAVESPHPEPSV